MYRMLDLFSGLCGASSAMRGDNRWEVVTVDFLEKFDTTICENIINLTPESFEEKEFDLIWASPPCVCFSMSSVGHYWKKEAGVYLPRKKKTIEQLGLVYHTLWLINSLNPKWWFIENPKAMLRKFIGNPPGWVTYCQYGEDRMKPTDLWGTHPPSFRYKHCYYRAKCHPPTPRGATVGTRGMKNSESAAKVPYLLSLAIKKAVESPGLPKRKLTSKLHNIKLEV